MFDAKELLSVIEIGLLIGAGLAGYVIAKQQSEKKTVPMMRSVEAIQKVLLPPARKDSDGVEEAVTPIWQQLSNLTGTLEDMRQSHRIADSRMVQVDQKLLNVEARLTVVDSRLERAGAEQQEQRELLGKIDSRVTQIETVSRARLRHAARAR